MRDRLIGHEPEHPLQLPDGLVVLRLPLVGDPQIEPCVRDARILLLRAFEFRQAALELARANQGQAVVDAFGRRIRRQRQRALELAHRLVLRGRVLVERLAQIAMVPDPLLHRRLGGRDRARNQSEKRHEQHAAQEIVVSEIAPESH